MLAFEESFKKTDPSFPTGDEKETGSSLLANNIKYSQKMRELSVEIVEIKTTLEIAQAAILDAIIYRPQQFSEHPSFDDYERMGRNLRQECHPPVIGEMRTLARNTYSMLRNNKELTTPSFIVCGSSGTGKTQLPFSLDIPLLYFTIPTMSQPIYSSFFKISDHLNTLLEIDFWEFCEGSGITKKSTTTDLDRSNEKTFSSDKFLYEFLMHIKFQFRTPGFLVALIQEMFELKEKNTAEYWPRLQATMKKSITPGIMSASTARDKLNEISQNFPPATEDQPMLPLIFIDEFNVESSSTPFERARYVFSRNIIRACGLIPVLMGTNSHITNMVKAGDNSGNLPCIWTHVFYQLPQYPESKLREELGTHLSSGNVSEAQKVYEEQFINLMFELLRRERPLFVNIVLEKLKNFKWEMIQTSEDFADYFDSIVDVIQYKFLHRKSGHMSFFFRRQIRFFENSYQAAHNNGKSLVCAAYIHTHLANLVIPENIHKKASSSETYFDLYRTADRIHYLELPSASKNNESNTKKNRPHLSDVLPRGKNYTAAASLPTFFNSPLSCMAFSRNINEFNCAFRSNDNKVFTAFQAVTESYKLSTIDKAETSIQLDGGALEQIVNLAFLISSHSNGLMGMSFIDWFPFFIHQLSCYPNNRFVKIPQAIEMGEKFPFEQEHIPYFGFNSSDWSIELKNYLLGRNIPFGSFKGAFKESIDLLAQRYDPDDVLAAENSTQFICSNTQKPEEIFEPQSKKSSGQTQPQAIKYLFAIECKFWEINLGHSLVKGIIGKVMNNNLQGKINFIVARQYSKKMKFHFDPKCDIKKDIVKIKYLEKKRIANMQLTEQHEAADAQKIPYNNLKIYKLIRRTKPDQFRTLDANCSYSNESTQLMLETVYDCTAEIELIFILIDLTEIHGKTHLTECICNLK